MSKPCVCNLVRPIGHGTQRECQTCKVFLLLLCISHPKEIGLMLNSGMRFQRRFKASAIPSDVTTQNEVK